MRVMLFLLALSGCAVQQPYYPGQPEVNRRNQGIVDMTPAQADCVSRAIAAGAGVYNHSLVWQMAIQGETERAVYVTCMQGKGLDLNGQPLTASPASSPPG